MMRSDLRFHHRNYATDLTPLKPWVIMCTARCNVKESHLLLILHLCVCV